MKKIILLLLITILTGCNYHELDNIALVSNVKIHYTNNNCIMYINFYNKNVKPLYIKGKTFKQAINKISIKTHLNLEFSHLNEIIVDKNIKSNNFKEILNYFDNKTSNFYIFIDAKTNNNHLKETYEKIKNKKNYKTSSYKEIKHTKNKTYILGSTNFKDCYLVKDFRLIKKLEKNNQLF